MSVEDVARELYTGPPGEFVAARDEAARRAREAGDRGEAAEIRKLKRPTAAAWAVNLLVADSPGDVDDLLDLGERMRAAQGEMRVADLRELSGERTRLVSRLVRRAAGLAGDAGGRPAMSVERDIATTLDAAVADPDAGSAVRAGTLTKALSYSGTGFGGGPADIIPFPGRDTGGDEKTTGKSRAGRAKERAREDGAAKERAGKDGQARRGGKERTDTGGRKGEARDEERDQDRDGEKARAHREAEGRRRAVAKAEDAVEAAQRSRDEARQALDAERERRESAAAERHRLRTELDRAERTLARADERVQTAGDRVDTAEQALDRARHRLSEAKSGRASG